MSKTQMYRLGLEELAMGISIAGFPEAAKGMLVANLGEMDKNEEHGRLMAANHSLMAKNLLFLEDDGPHLELDFEKVVAALTQYDYTLRFSVGSGEKEEILAYYYKGKEIVKHENLQGVAHIFSFASGFEQVIEDSAAFLGISQHQEGEYPKAEVEQSALDEAKVIAATKPEKLMDFLGNVGVPKEPAELLSEDLIQPVCRGSVMRVELVKNQMIADRGFLLLKGQQRSWFFPIVVKGDVTYANIIPGIMKTLEQEIQALL